MTAVAWDDLGIKQKVDLVTSCAKTCAADIGARAVLGAEQTTAPMVAFRADLESCGKTCGFH